MTTQTTTRKQQAAFPEVATIRKGGQKIKGVKDGREYETVGPDLNDRFRVVFAPGAEEMKAKFLAQYQTDQPHKIKAVIPFTSVWQAWEYYNEAYSAGRLIARANDDRFLIYRNPLTGVYEVTNGDPYKEFHPGMKVTYERKGKQYELPIKCTGRLKLWLPYVDIRLVYFTLKTTSYYDCQNISANLAAVQQIASALPAQHGSVAGIPIWIYRVEKEITWNKPDGGAQRVKKWLVQIEVDPEFVKSAFARMTQYALTGNEFAPQLPAGDPIMGDVDPEEESDSDELSDDEQEFWGVKAQVPEGEVREEIAGSDAPAVTPNLAAPKMSYEMACTVKSKEGQPYHGMPIEQLIVRYNTLGKIPRGQRTPEQGFKLDALEVLIAYKRENGNG